MKCHIPGVLILPDTQTKLGILFYNFFLFHLLIRQNYIILCPFFLFLWDRERKEENENKL